MMRISALPADGLKARLPEFGALLHACVLAGASIGFVLPFSLKEGEAFWRDTVLPGVSAGTRVLFTARIPAPDGDRLAGTVQLCFATLPNQAHRAEVSKLLVHPEFRRRGVARALMEALEIRARALGRTLLTLDTRTGDSAEPLYMSMGYSTTGTIPDYCRHPFEDRLEATTIMYKALNK